MMLFILFLYQETLKNVTVAITMHSDEAVVQNALRCKRGHDTKTVEGLDLQGKACHMFIECADQSCSALVYSTVKYVQRALLCFTK